MRALAEHAFHSASQRNGIFAKLVTQMVRRGQRAPPFLAHAFIGQRELGFAGIKGRNLHAQQSDGAARGAIGAEQFADGDKNL